MGHRHGPLHQRFIRAVRTPSIARSGSSGGNISRQRTVHEEQRAGRSRRLWMSETLKVGLTLKLRATGHEAAILGGGEGVGVGACPQVLGSNRAFESTLPTTL